MNEIEAMLTPKRPYASELRAEWRESNVLFDGPMRRHTLAMVRLIEDLERIDRLASTTLRAIRQRRQRETKQERPLCGARTRAGGSCKARCVEGKAKCRMHGGLSTGAKTAEGRAAIVASNKRRASRST